MARGEKVRCQWLDEMKEGANGPFVRSRLVAMEVAHGVRIDTFAGTAPLKCIKIIISRAASIKNTRGEHSRELALYDTSVAFWHALLPEDEPIAMYPPRGEEEAGYMWQMKRAMYGTRRASRLFQEHMKGVLKEAGYAALKACHQGYHCLETDSMAAIHGDDIIAEGEPEKLDRLDEVLKQLVVVKVLDRVGAAEYGQYLKRHIVYINGQGFEWLEDPKHLAAIIRNRSKVGAKPQSSPSSKDLGKNDPEALDELEEVEGKLYQQDTGISIYVSSGRFDIQLCVKRLCEMMTKPRKLGNLRLARLARYLVGTEKLVLRFDHQEYGDIVRFAVDSDWAGSEERHSTHAGLEFHGEHLVDSWVPSDQVRALSSGEAELYGIVDGSARGIFTKHMHEEMGRTINIDVETDSMAAIGMCSRTGVGKTRHIQVRWLWIQDAIRDKVVRLRKVRGTDNEADMGTKDLDGPTHQRLLQKLPLKPTQCRRLLGLIATANGGSVVEARMSGNVETLEKFSAQVMIVMLIALVARVLLDVLRQKRQLEATPLGKNVERGTRTEFNPVSQITVPTNVYYSLGGECYHTSRKCEGLKNVPMDAIRRRRSCMYCAQRNGQ